MKKTTIYTDGSCLKNPGIGGWAGILMFGNKKKEISGAEDKTTNNRMELFAIIQSLKCLKEACIVDVYSDSAYVINAFNNGWIDNWIAKGWKTTTNKEVQNIDLWKELIDLTHIHKVNFLKVKGHSDNEYNNRCDELARNSATKLQGK